MKPHIEGVPTGHYCYGYAPAPNSGFSSATEVRSYLKKKYGNANLKDEMAEHMRLLVPKYCRFWNPTKHGFVECRHLNIKAFWITITEEPIQKSTAHFGSEEEMEKHIEGFLLGDAVKECDLNLDGNDFEID